MEEKKLKAMFFNDSPRKNKNTTNMLRSLQDKSGCQTIWRRFRWIVNSAYLYKRI